MQRFKILELWFEKNTKTGQFKMKAEVNHEAGGPSTEIEAIFNNGIPFNALSIGWQEIKDKDEN